MKIRKLAIVIDEFNQTTINTNVGRFAKYMSKNNIFVDIITDKQKLNRNLKLIDAKIDLKKIDANDKWPQLNHGNLKKYFIENMDSYFGIWLYKGRPYSNWIIKEASGKNILTILKLDSDINLSVVGVKFFNYCVKNNLDPKDIFKKYHFIFKLLSVVPSFKGFFLYDSNLFNASIVLCEKRDFEKKLKKYIPKINTLYYPNSISVKEFSLFEKKYKGKKKINKILSVGRIDPNKQFENAIEAFNQLPEEIKRSWKYEIVGPIFDYSYYKNLKTIINENKLGSLVTIRKGLYGEELLKKFMESSIFLLPSKKEGVPNVLTEAMYFENTILASNLPGIRSMIKNNKNGILINASSPNDISKVLLKIVESKSTRNLLSEEARKEIILNYNLDRIGEKLYKEIKKIDFNLYFNNQKSDTLAQGKPEIIEQAVYKYLDFFVKQNSKKINFKNAKLLDIGCREFFTYDYFLKNYNNKITGIDILDPALKYAKHKNIRELDIHKMDRVLKNNNYDAIFSFHVFEHMYDLDKALSNCYKLLKPNGQLFFALPMPAIDSRRFHWIDIRSVDEMNRIMIKHNFKKIYSKNHKKDEFRNEPEMLGIFSK